MKKAMMFLLALSLICILAVGSTMSYLTYTDADVNTMVVGNVKITQLEQKRQDGALVDFVDDVKLLPITNNATADVEINGTNYALLNTANNAVDKIVTVKNEGTEAAYVRTLIAFEMLDNGDGTWTSPFAANLNKVDNGITMTDVTFVKDGVHYIVGTYVYDAELAAGATSAPSLLQVYLAAEEKGEFFIGVGASYEIHILSQAVQAAGFTGGAAAALNDAFGDVTAANAATWFGGVTA